MPPYFRREILPAQACAMVSTPSFPSLRLRCFVLSIENRLRSSHQPLPMLPCAPAVHCFAASQRCLCLRDQWNPLASLKAFSGNPLLKTTAKITLLYYTSVWAVVSTLMVYVARQFQFGPVKVRTRVSVLLFKVFLSLPAPNSFDRVKC